MITLNITRFKASISQRVTVRETGRQCITGCFYVHLIFIVLQWEIAEIKFHEIFQKYSWTQQKYLCSKYIKTANPRNIQLQKKVYVKTNCYTVDNYDIIIRIHLGGNQEQKSCKCYKTKKGRKLIDILKLLEKNWMPAPKIYLYMTGSDRKFKTMVSFWPGKPLCIKNLDVFRTNIIIRVLFNQFFKQGENCWHLQSGTVATLNSQHGCYNLQTSNMLAANCFLLSLV